MAVKYLDDTGLAYLWAKIKAYVDSHAGSGTPTPTANATSAFDSSAKMNSTDMTSAQVSDFVDSLSGSGIAPVDYIVEQGTSGIWTYRKWNSGIAECWGEHTATLSPYQQAFGGYAFYTSVNFPSGLFSAYPQVKYSAAISNSTSGYGFALTGTLTSVLSPSTVNLYAVSNINNSCSTVWMVEAKGRWK